MNEFDKSPIALIFLKGEFVPSIFVSNLAKLKDTDIIKRFEQFGPVRGFDRGLPFNNLFGFVYFEKKETVTEILRSHLVVQGININGTKVKVQDGEPKLKIHRGKIYYSKLDEAKRLKPDDTKAKPVTNASIHWGSTAIRSLASNPAPAKLKFKENTESKTKDSTIPLPLQKSPSFPYPQHPEQLNLPITADNDPVVSGESKIHRSLFFYGIGDGNRSKQITIFKEYFSKFGFIIEMNISSDTHNKSNGYGYCIFEKALTVDKIQRARPHRLGGTLFYTKRTIHLDKNFLKEPANTTKMSYNTIFIYGIPEISATENLYSFFKIYGKILDIYLSPNVDLFNGRHSFVTFEDFDSVDIVSLLHRPTLNGKIVKIYKVWSKLEVEYAKKNYRKYISIINEKIIRRAEIENRITIPTLISTKKMSPVKRPAAKLTTGTSDDTAGFNSKSTSLLSKNSSVPISPTSDHPTSYTQSSSLCGSIRNNLSSNRSNPYPVQSTSTQREVLPQSPALPNLPFPPICRPGSQEWITYWDRHDGTFKLFNLRMERYIKYMRDYI